MFTQRQIRRGFDAASGARLFDARADDAAEEQGSGSVGGEGVAEGGGLEDAAEDEREYLRGRLREELKREPTEEELNEWLRRHTEGY